LPTSSSWSIEFSREALADLTWLRENDRKGYSKCFDLVLSVTQDPFAGIGKPEPLKYLGPGIWSRRVNQEDRMVYVVKNTMVVVSGFRFHY